jgi:hypothetical protein
MARIGVIAVLTALVLVVPEVRAGDWSPEYRASLQRTLELRKQRRRLAESQPVGQMFLYPMPPALIIRHTPEVHEEIEDLLRALRY